MPEIMQDMQKNSGTIVEKCLYLLSTGVVNPGQGGGGLFNYQVIGHFITKGYHVEFISVADKEFIAKHSLKPEYVGYRISLDNPGIPKEVIMSRLKINMFYSTKSVRFRMERKGLITKILIFGDNGRWLRKISDIDGISAHLILGDLASLRHFEGLRSIDKEFQMLGVSIKRAIVGYMRYLQARLHERLLFDRIKKIKGLSVSTLSPYEYYLIKKQLPYVTLTRWFTPYHENMKPININQDNLNGAIKLLMIGDMHTTASTLILKALGDFMTKYNTMPGLPMLEFHFVGSTSESSRMKLEYNKSEAIDMIFHDYCNELDDYFHMCDALVAIGDYRCGIRTRIITAFSYGIPVIASSAFSYGLIDPVDKVHWLLCNGSNELTSIIIKFASREIDLRRIGAAGRLLWERNYNPLINMLDLECKIPDIT